MNSEKASGRSVVSDAEILDLYQMGLPWREFDRSYSVSSKRLRRVLKENDHIVVGRKNPDIKLDRTSDIIAQYDAKGLITKDLRTGCVELNHRIDAYGYPTAQINGKNHKVSRLVLEQKGVKIQGLLACHKCNNTKCISPEHLYAGTTLENSGDSRTADTLAKGSRAGASKLTEDQVVLIRQLHSEGATQKELRFLFGIGNSAMSALINRRTWKHC